MYIFTIIAKLHTMVFMKHIYYNSKNLAMEVEVSFY